jgi:hypothetical protein
VTVRLYVKPESVGMVIGPLEPRLRSDLESEGEDEISLRRLLSTLVETVDVEPGDGGDWLSLEKRVPIKHPTRR